MHLHLLVPQRGNPLVLEERLVLGRRQAHQALDNPCIHRNHADVRLEQSKVRIKCLGCNPIQIHRAPATDSELAQGNEIGLVVGNEISLAPNDPNARFKLVEAAPSVLFPGLCKLFQDVFDYTDRIKVQEDLSVPVIQKLLALPEAELHQLLGDATVLTLRRSIDILRPTDWKDQLYECPATVPALAPSAKPGVESSPQQSDLPTSPLPCQRTTHNLSSTPMHTESSSKAQGSNKRKRDLDACPVSSAQGWEQHQVDSSYIRMVAYHADSNTCRVELKSGCVYEYADADWSAFEALCEGRGCNGSVGRHYNTIFQFWHPKCKKIKV